MTTSSERRYDLDWLRVLGVLLLVPFHAALIFVLEPYTIMYIRDSVNSRILADMAGFIHMWHMPMLFMISGAATYFALSHRSAGGYLRERCLRLFIPLFFGLLTFVPFTIYIQHSDVLSLQEGYTGFFRIDWTQLDGMNGTFTPAHLWFILFLLVFSIVGLPVFQWLQTVKGKNLIERSRIAKRASLTLTVLGIPLTLTAATGILGAMNPLYYFLLFFYGFVFASDGRFQQAIDRWMWVALAFGLFATILNVVAPMDEYLPWTSQWLAAGPIYQMGRWALTLATLGLGHKFLNRPSALLRDASEAAMPFYLLHMTFSVVTGYFVIQLSMPVALKYPIIVLGATGSTLLAYELVRRWNITRFLFGMKPAKNNLPIS